MSDRVAGATERDRLDTEVQHCTCDAPSAVIENIGTISAVSWVRRCVDCERIVEPDNVS